MLVRTPAAEIREIGRNTQGVRVVRLKDGDQVVGVASAPMDEAEPSDAAPTDETSVDTRGEPGSETAGETRQG